MWKMLYTFENITANWQLRILFRNDFRRLTTEHSTTNLSILETNELIHQQQGIFTEAV